MNKPLHLLLILLAKLMFIVIAVTHAQMALSEFSLLEVKLTVLCIVGTNSINTCAESENESCF